MCNMDRVGRTRRLSVRELHCARRLRAATMHKWAYLDRYGGGGNRKWVGSGSKVGGGGGGEGMWKGEGKLGHICSEHTLLCKAPDTLIAARMRVMEMVRL